MGSIIKLAGLKRSYPFSWRTQGPQCHPLPFACPRAPQWKPCAQCPSCARPGPQKPPLGRLLAQSATSASAWRRFPVGLLGPGPASLCTHRKATTKTGSLPVVTTRSQTTTIAGIPPAPRQPAPRGQPGPRARCGPLLALRTGLSRPTLLLSTAVPSRPCFLLWAQPAVLQIVIGVAINH